MAQMFGSVQELAGQHEEFNHRFFLRVKDILDAGDLDAISKERIATKLMRLSPACQDGFILSDFPKSLADAEELEEFKGGLNAFVHFTLPLEVLVNIEEVRHVCDHCEKVYYSEDILSEKNNVRIEKFMPKDGICGDCGSTQFHKGHDPVAFEDSLERYESTKGEVLDFYNHYGLLVDFELRSGFNSYDNLKR